MMSLPRAREMLTLSRFGASARSALGGIGAASTRSRITASHSRPWKRWIVLHSTTSARRRAARRRRISAACAVYGVMTAIEVVPARTASSARSAVITADAGVRRESCRAPRAAQVVRACVSMTAIGRRRERRVARGDGPRLRAVGGVAHAIAVEQPPHEPADRRMHAVLHREHRDDLGALGIGDRDLEDVAADGAAHAAVA